MSHQLTFTSIHNYGSEAVIVPVELESGDKLVRTDAFIDTGATFCVFKRELATALDIDVDSGTPLRFSTVTGGFDAYGHILSVKTFGYSFDVMVYFAALETVKKLNCMMFTRMDL